MEQYVYQIKFGEKPEKSEKSPEKSEKSPEKSAEKSAADLFFLYFIALYTITATSYL